MNQVRANGGDFSKFYKRMKERSKKLSTNAYTTSYIRGSPSTASPGFRVRTLSTNIYQKINRERSTLEYENNAERGSIERARTSIGGQNHGGRHQLKTMLRDSTISSSLHEGSIISQADSKVLNPLKNSQLKHSIVIPTNFHHKKSMGAKTSYNVSMSTILQKN